MRNPLTETWNDLSIPATLEEACFIMNLFQSDVLRIIRRGDINGWRIKGKWCIDKVTLCEAAERWKQKPWPLTVSRARVRRDVTETVRAAEIIIYPPPPSARVFTGYAEPVSSARIKLSEGKRVEILERDGYACNYCLGEATEIDHIIPYSYIHFNRDDNLVAACSLCNQIASDKVFNSLADKRRYIIRERMKRGIDEPTRKEICFCIDCDRAFFPCVKGSTNFLCQLCAGK